MTCPCATCQNPVLGKPGIILACDTCRREIHCVELRDGAQIVPMAWKVINTFGGIVRCPNCAEPVVIGHADKDAKPMEHVSVTFKRTTGVT